MLEQALNEDTKLNPILNVNRPRRTPWTVCGGDDAETATDLEVAIQSQQDDFVPEQYLMDHCGRASNYRVHRQINSHD
jgi:hypothetical protein